jgi:DNA polymerase-2
MAQPTGRVRSYVQYGRMVYQPASYTFRGRWHVDRQNCFLWREGEWEGLLEVARVAKLPVQHMSRTSVGRGITSMQLETLHRDGYLVPWRKREPEDFKTADELITADKGGLVFQPLVGFHENVAEIDFASMYPALMVAHNISPETVNCRCCAGKVTSDECRVPRNGGGMQQRVGSAKTVPELGYRICERREGFVTRTLRPLLAKRAKYKRMRDGCFSTLDTRHSSLDGHSSLDRHATFDSRQSSLKWLLVVCFGYLGYKNARFGRIEAHESTTAWSREILLQAKEIAESRGFEMIHAIVDCIWVHKEGATVEDYKALAQTVAELTEIPTTLEGVYRWLRFVPSVTNPRIGVPNRYVGVFQNGKTKVRGLALRRHDTPRFIKNVQQRIIDHFAKAKNLVEYRALIPEAQRIVDEAVSDIRSGLLDYQEVAIFRAISKSPEMYQKATINATVAKELTRRGVKLHAGEGIEYVVTDAKHKIPDWRAKAAAGIDTEWSYDPQYYVELLLKACEEVFACSEHAKHSEPRP